MCYSFLYIWSKFFVVYYCSLLLILFATRRNNKYKSITLISPTLFLFLKISIPPLLSYRNFKMFKSIISCLIDYTEVIMNRLLFLQTTNSSYFFFSIFVHCLETDKKKYTNFMHVRPKVSLAIYQKGESKDLRIALNIF